MKENNVLLISPLYKARFDQQRLFKDEIEKDWKVEFQGFFNMKLTGGTLMIQNLTIKNFRTHRDVKMKELTNVNILLGKNNSGKTAVLEALLFLSLPSNPQNVLIRLNELRGYRTDEDSTEIWDSLFYNWDRSQKIHIEVEEVSDEKMLPGIQVRRVLNMQSLTGEDRESSNDTDIYESPNSVDIIESSDFKETTKGISFIFKGVDGETINRKVTGLRPLQPIRSDDYPRKDQKVLFVAARGIPNPRTEAVRFSQLEIAKRHNEVVNALQIIEPELKRLLVVATARGNAIYGDIGKDHLMPIPLMGDGMSHMLSIALAMANSQNGLVLIDEIENGLHYSVLTDLWRMIFETSRKLDIQVFVATHSDECIKAAYEAVESLGCYDNLKLYRFDKTKDGTRVEDYIADELFHAITSKIEVR